MPLLWPKRCRGEWTLPSNERVLSDRQSLHTSGGRNGAKHLDEKFRSLPAGVVEMLDAQAIRHRQDFDMAITQIPSAKDAYQRSNRHAEDSFNYGWCIVNTRCLYFDPPAISTQPTKPHNDPLLTSEELARIRNQSHDGNRFMVLCPLIDLFNHTSDPASACKVTHDSFGFTVTSPEVSTGDEDEEVFVSYGTHSNDFLLVEYGFVLPDDNQHDSISLDSVVLATLSVQQRRRLYAKGYLGEYTLFLPAANGGEANVCWRTEVVARLEILSAVQWDSFVNGLLDEEKLDQDVEVKARATIRAWVTEMERHAKRSVGALDKISNDHQEIMNLFGDVIENNEHAQAAAPSTKHADAALKTIESERKLARRRYDLILERWRQILQICGDFLRHSQT